MWFQTIQKFKIEIGGKVLGKERFEEYVIEIESL
jgi:hypothetical protein